MPDSLPPITPAHRQRLQKLWEEARAIMAQAGSPPGRKDAEQVHELLLECVLSDPGNTVYLDAFLLNLRQIRMQPKGWWTNLLRRKSPETLGPALLKNCSGEEAYSSHLLQLADQSSKLDAPEAEIRYLREALHFSPQDPRVLLKLSRSLLRQGRFDEAGSVVHSLASAAGGSDEVRSLLAILDGPVSPFAPRKDVLSRSESRQYPADFLAIAAEHVALQQFNEAEAAAAKALSLSGGDLTVREQAEEIALSRLKNNVAIARRLVEHEPSPAHQQTLRRWEEELGRLELATLHARSERFPQDAGLKLEVAIRLRRAGNYSGAIQRLEEIAADHSLRPSVLTELGECWQHLRQFDRALDLYTQAITVAEEQNQSDPHRLALYRAGSLAAAMQRTADAKAAFQRLLTLAPNFKDARQRLLLLDT